MSPKTKIIVAGAVVTALIGLIVIDLATSPEKKAPPPVPAAERTTARTPRPPRPTPPPIQREIIPLPGPTVRPDLSELESSFLRRQENPGTTPAIPDDVPPPDRPSEYTVVSGDSFWKIAGKVYGDASLFNLIQQANPSAGEFGLVPGAKLQVPAKPARRSATVRTSSSGSPGTSRPRDANVEVYVIKPRDILWNIAKPYAKARGVQVPAMVQAIRDANPGLDPDRLKVDAEIVIPR